MGFRRGRVHVANFNPSKGSEAGKIRPCLIIQIDLLNDAEHPSTTVLPLTTRLVDDAAPLRFRITPRGGLRERSDVMIDQIRTIDNRRINVMSLATLTDDELVTVEEYLRLVLALGA